MPMLKVVGLVIAAMLVLVAPAAADDWVAAKLRGRVLQLVGTEWVPLARGDVVPDARVIRTLASGRVEFERDAEVIAVGPETQIRIHDKAGRRFTTVEQYYGEVTIEAEVRNVQHFAVETPYLAAVVKGTRFVVRSGKGSASVEVKRGQVEVTGGFTHSVTVLAAGQKATAGAEAELVVSGKGKLPPIIGANGKPVGPGVGNGKGAGPGKGNDNVLHKGLDKGLAKGLDKAGGAAQGAASGVGRGVGNAAGAAGNAVGGVGAAIGNAAGAVGGAVGGSAGNAVGSAGNAVGNAAGAVGGAVGQVGGAVGGALGGLTGRGR